MKLERKGQVEFLVLKSEISEKAAAGISRLMQHAIDSGTWEQTWPPPADDEPADEGTPT
ncbi:hypothetical protein [Streptomyces youssoufiensis]